MMATNCRKKNCIAIWQRDNTVLGYKASDEAIKRGWLDYATLAKIIGNMVPISKLFRELRYDFDDVNGALIDEEGEWKIFSQHFIITPAAAKTLMSITDKEVVFYSEKYDIYVWAIMFGNISWEDSLTDIKLIPVDSFQEIEEKCYEEE